MPSQGRIVRVIILVVLTASWLGGCGESAKSPPQSHEATKTTLEQELASLLKNAEAGDPQAQVNLAAKYRDGEDVPKDFAKAIEWHQKAAAQGHADAQFNLGLAFVRGQGVPKDASKAIEWYQKAAAQGNVTAQLNLGGMYGSSVGVARDAVLSYAWFNVASTDATVGSVAAPLREEIGRAMSPPEISEAQRISSEWKKGQILARESRPVTANASMPSGSPSKQESGTGLLANSDGLKGAQRRSVNESTYKSCMKSAAETSPQSTSSERQRWCVCYAEQVVENVTSADIKSFSPGAGPSTRMRTVARDATEYCKKILY